VSGTLERLVAQLIESNQSEKLAVLTGYTGPDYVYTFLLSHTYFTTSTIFLEKLQEHYFASPPPGLGPGELKVIESKQLGTQTRFPPPSLFSPHAAPHRIAHTHSFALFGAVRRAVRERVFAQNCEYAQEVDRQPPLFL
jgi:hypothetical protein